MFITAVCVIFLIKLRWPKSKSLYYTGFVVVVVVYNTRTSNFGAEAERSYFFSI